MRTLRQWFCRHTSTEETATTTHDPVRGLALTVFETRCLRCGSENVPMIHDVSAPR